MVRRPLGVPILACDDVAGAGENGRVETCRLEPSRVVDDPQIGVQRGYSLDNRTGAIGRAAVGDNHLESIGRVILRKDRFQAGLDVALLVEDGNHHTDERGSGGGRVVRPGCHGACPRLCHESISAPSTVGALVRGV